MSKITFRADDDLVRRLEEFDASKSEVMRDALRAYLDEAGAAAERDDADAAAERDDDATDAGDGVDAALADRVDELIEARLDAALPARGVGRRAQDVNVNVNLTGAETQPAASATESGVTADSTNGAEGGDDRKTPPVSTDEGANPAERTCAQCGENVDENHVYCPNCGEKATRRVFCDCGDELRTDWAFCPGCGRRTPAADVLDRA